VFVILVYVYPLRMVAGMAFASFSGGILAEHGGPAIASVADLRALYVTFSAGYGVTVIIFTLLYRHALHCASALELSAHERLHARLAIVRNLGFLTVAVTSLVLALTLPMSNDHPLLYALPGMAYVLIWPYSLWLRHRATRLSPMPGA